MGKRRSGKSYTLGALAEGLVAQSWIRQGTDRQGVLILDTMNVYLTMPIPVAETVREDSDQQRELSRWRLGAEHIPTVLFHPIGTSLPNGLIGETISLRPSDLDAEEWCALFEADPFVDPMGHLLTEIHGKVSTEGYPDSTTGRRVAGRPEFQLDDLRRCLDVDADLQRYPSATREALSRRLDAVGRLPVFSNQGLDVRRLLRPGQLSVLLLRDLDHNLRSVMIALIVKRMLRLRSIAEQYERMMRVHEARAAASQLTDPAKVATETAAAAQCREHAMMGLPRSWLIIDEAHNYIPANSAVPSRRQLKKYVDEGRNLGLSIVVATQQPSGLDGSIQRNADVLLVHSLSHRDDIMAAEGMLNTAGPEEITVDAHQRFAGPRAFEALVRSLPIGYALVSTDRANRFFPMCVRPRITLHGGADY